MATRSTRKTRRPPRFIEVLDTTLHDGEQGRWCMNQNSPAPILTRGVLPTDAVRLWPAQGGHLIQEVAREECLGHSPSWSASTRGRSAARRTPDGWRSTGRSSSRRPPPGQRDARLQLGPFSRTAARSPSAVRRSWPGAAGCPRPGQSSLGFSGPPGPRPETDRATATSAPP